MIDLYNPPASPQVKDPRQTWIQESNLWISGFQVLDSGFFVTGTWIPDLIVNGIPDSVSCIPNSRVYDSKTQIFRIPNTKCKTLPESRFFYIGWPILHTSSQWPDVKESGNIQSFLSMIVYCRLACKVVATMQLSRFGMLSEELERVFSYAKTKTANFVIYILKHCRENKKMTTKRWEC